MQRARGERGGGRYAVLAVGLLLAALVPAAATAGARPVVPPGFSVAASHGYKLTLVGFDGTRSGVDETKNEDVVYMYLRKPGSVALYATDLRSVSGHRIVADFPGVAEVDVAFHPSGGGGNQKRACSEERIAYRKGFYEGSFRFAGEEGYAAAEASRARADLDFFADLDCSGGFGISTGAHQPGADLEAKTLGELDPEDPLDEPQPAGPPEIGVRAEKNGPRDRALIEASIEEDLGTMLVLRGVQRRFDASTFDYPPSLAGAVLAPPAPFSGSATFSPEAPVARRWSGDLTVDLPGRADLPLTGARFRAHLRHARFTHEAPHPTD